MAINPLLDVLRPQQLNRPNNPMAILSEFKDFASKMTPEKAQQQIQQMLSSGQMSQQQFNELQVKAKEFMQFFGMK